MAFSIGRNYRNWSNMFVWSWWVFATIAMYIFIFVVPGRLLARLVFPNPKKWEKRACRILAVSFYLVVINLLTYACGAFNHWENSPVTDAQVAKQQFGFEEGVAYPMTSLGRYNLVFVVDGKSWDIQTPPNSLRTIIESRTQPPSISFDMPDKEAIYDLPDVNMNDFFRGQHQVRHDMLDCRPVIRNLVLSKQCTDTVTESSWNGNPTPSGLTGWIGWNMGGNHAGVLHATMVMTPEMHAELIGKIGG